MKDKGTVAVSALQFLPARLSLRSLHEAFLGWRGCPLYQNATRTVFGEGNKMAQIILVGEMERLAADLKAAAAVLGRS